MFSWNCASIFVLQDCLAFTTDTHCQAAAPVLTLLTGDHISLTNRSTMAQKSRRSLYCLYSNMGCRNQPLHRNRVTLFSAYSLGESSSIARVVKYSAVFSQTWMLAVSLGPALELEVLITYSAMSRQGSIWMLNNGPPPPDSTEKLRSCLEYCFCQRPKKFIRRHLHLVHVKLADDSVCK